MYRTGFRKVLAALTAAAMLETAVQLQPDAEELPQETETEVLTGDTNEEKPPMIPDGSIGYPEGYEANETDFIASSEKYPEGVYASETDDQLTAEDETFSDSVGIEEVYELNEAETDSVSWTIEEGVLTVSGSGAIASYSSSSAQPWYADADSIVEIRVLDGITGIGARAFEGLQNMTKASLADSIESIGFRAFANCTALSEINLPLNWKECPSSSSSGTLNVNYCGQIFNGDKALTYLNVPEGLTVLPGYAFNKSDYLEKVDLPSTLTVIGNHTFYDCSSLKEIVIPSGVTAIQKSAFCNASALTEVTIPEGVTSLGSYAFNGCKSLVKAVLADSIESIGYVAFANCTVLSEINIPLNWNDCPSSASDGTLNVDYCGHIFEGDKALTHLSVPEGMSALPSFAFNKSDYLVSVDLPSTLTQIRNHTFYNCTALTSVTIPDGVTAIGKSAFYGAKKLSEVEIPEGVISLGSYVFNSCTGLTKVKLADSIESIGYVAFANCTSLNEINIPLNWNDCPSNANDGTVNVDYCGHIFEGDKALTHLSVPEGITALPSFAFNKCDYLVSVDLPSSLTEIKNQTFYNCTALKEITIPDGVVTIGKSAFCYASALTEVTVPEGVTALGMFAFYSCTNLRKAVLANSIESIGYQAFANCTSLVDVNIPLNWNTCPSNATNGTISYSYCGHIFEGDTALLYVEVPEGKTSLPDYAFCSCDSLVCIILPDSLTEFGKYAFYGCKSLISMDIPDGVTTLPDSLFSGCSSLIAVNLGTNVTTIANNVFNGCSVLLQINYAGDESQWGSVTVGTSGNSKVNEVKILYNYKVTYKSKDFTGVFEGEYDGHHNDDVVRRHFVITFDECSQQAGNIYSVKGDMTFTPSQEIESPYSATGSYYFKGVVDLSTGVMFHQGYEFIVYPEGYDNFGYVTFNGMLAPDKNSIAGINNQVSTRTYEAFRLGIDLNSKTQALLTDETGSYNLLNEKVEYEKGAEDKATIIIKPDWRGKEPGRILLYQKDIALESRTGVFMDIKPATLFEADTPVYAILEDSSGSIAESKRLQLSIVVPASSRMNAYATSHHVVAYENKKLSTAADDDFHLSEGVLFQYGSGVAESGKNGSVRIPYDLSGSTTISKEGYITRNLSKERMAKASSVYLQKTNSKGPVISGVWVNDIDVLNNSFGVNMLGKKETSLELEIDWGKSSYGSVKLTQKNAVADFSGNILTLVLSDRFDTSSTIYIEAADADGRTTRKALKFENPAQGAVARNLQGASFSFGDKISIKLPDDFEPSLFSGQSFGISINGIETLVPINASASDGKFYVSIGFDLEKYSDTTKKTTERATGKTETEYEETLKTFIMRFKESGILNAKDAKEGLKKLAHIRSEFKDAIAKPQGVFGVEADFTVIGFLEGTYDDEGHFNFLDTGVILNPSISISRNMPFVLMAGPIPIPMFFETAFSGNFEGRFNVRLNNTAKNYIPNGSLSGELSLSGGVGVGVKKVLYFSGGLEGKLKPNWEINLPGRDYFIIKASINAYAKGGIAIFEGKYSFPSAEKTLLEYSNGSWDFWKDGIPAVPMIEFKPKDLSYLDQPSIFASDMINGNAVVLNTLTDDFNTAGNSVKTNIYRESTPEIADLGNGKKVLVWLDSDSSDYNGVNLYYSVYSNGEWSSPSKVEDDGTVDNTPVLKVIGGKAYLVWQDAQKAFDESELSLEGIAPYFDISTAVFDEESSKFVTYSIPNDHIDMIPDLAGDEENIYAVWVNNSEDSWFGSGSSNTIYCSQFDGSSWSEPEALYSNLNAVNALAADYQSELKVAYALDTDGDDETADDTRVFENEIMVSGDSLAYGPSYANHELYWNTGSNILCKETADMEDTFVTNQYRLLSVGDETAMVFTKADGLGSALYISYFNEETQKWGEGTALTDSSAFIGAFAACTDENGEISLVMNRREVTGDWEDEEPYGNSDLVMMIPENICDIRIGDVYYADNHFFAGADMPLQVDLTNSGTVTVNEQIIEIKDSSGNILSEITVGDKLAPGETITASIHYTVPEDVTAQDITITAAPSTYTDIDLSDNSTDLHLSFERSYIENEGYAYRNDNMGVIFADIINRGYETQSSLTVSLIKDTKDGEVLETKAIDTLDPLDPVHVEFERSINKDETYYLVLKDSQNEEMHSDFVYITEDNEPYVQVESITLNKTDLELEKGETYQLTANVLPDNASSPEVTWSSSDESVAEVDDNGLVTALSKGTAVITAEADGKAAECSVTVTDEESGDLVITVSPEELIMICGEEKRLNVRVEPEDTQYTITYSSENNNVAAVDSDGNVKAAGVGTTAIIIHVNEIEMKVPVRVLFTDVANSTKFFYDAVYWAYDHEPQITTGTSAATFSPNDNCTRGHIVTFLWRMMGQPEVEYDMPFTDVKEDKFYYKAVAWAASKGITTGTSATTFSPNDVCNRGQIVTFLWRAMGEPEPKTTAEFKDVTSNKFFYKAVSWAAENNITTGTSPTTFSPNDSCTRGHAVTFLYRTSLLKADK